MGHRDVAWKASQLQHLEAEMQRQSMSHGARLTDLQNGIHKKIADVRSKHEEVIHSLQHQHQVCILSGYCNCQRGGYLCRWPLQCELERVQQQSQQQEVEGGQACKQLESAVMQLKAQAAEQATSVARMQQQQKHTEVCKNTVSLLHGLTSRNTA
jgi:hypothetical protein